MLVTATAALLVLSTTAQAASKYNYGGRGSYAPSYKMRDYSHEPSYESYYAEDDYHEPSYESHYADQEYNHEPSYESHYAEDDYRAPDHDSYGGDAYSEEPSYTYEPSTKSRPAYKQSHEPRSYRHKRSAEEREGQSCDYFDGDKCMVCSRSSGCKQNKKYKPPKIGESVVAYMGSPRGGQSMFLFSEPHVVGLDREGQRTRCECTNDGPKGNHRACSVGSRNDGDKFFCYVKSPCKDSKTSLANDNLLYSTGACCGFLNPCKGS